MTVSAGLDSRLVTGRYLFKHSPQDGLDKVLAAYGEEIQTGAVAKSYTRKGFVIYKEMRKYLVVHREAFSHI